MITGQLHWLAPYTVLFPLLLAIIALWRHGRALSLSIHPFTDGMTFKHPLLKLIPQQQQRSATQRRWQWLLISWLWLMLSLALAQPVRIGEQLPDLPPERDIVLLVDVSISMTLKDYRYEGEHISRLDVLKRLLHDFVEQLQGERLAMIVFAEKPYVLVPLTRDHTLLQRQLQRLQGAMMGRISALGDAIMLGLKEASKHPQRKQIFVLFTDANESIGRVAPEAAAKLATESAIPLYSIAIGSTAKNRADIEGGVLYQPVSMELLQTLAKQTEGKAYEADNTQAIEEALKAINQQQQNKAEAPPRYQQHALYAWFLLAGLLPLLLAQLWLVSGKKKT
jgi:Ca-activated chloride channel family protein